MKQLIVPDLIRKVDSKIQANRNRNWKLFADVRMKNVPGWNI